jgi:hypothetical protein
MVAVPFGRLGVRHLVVNMVGTLGGEPGFRIPVDRGSAHLWIRTRHQGKEWWWSKRSATPVRFSPRGNA